MAIAKAAMTNFEIVSSLKGFI